MGPNLTAWAICRREGFPKLVFLLTSVVIVVDDHPYPTVTGGCRQTGPQLHSLPWDISRLSRVMCVLVCVCVLARSLPPSLPLSVFVLGMSDLYTAQANMLWLNRFWAALLSAPLSSFTKVAAVAVQLVLCSNTRFVTVAFQMHLSRVLKASPSCLPPKC